MNTTFYAEFDSTGMSFRNLGTYQCSRELITFHLCGCSGPGGNTSERISLEHILTRQEANNFTIDKVFLERPKWIDYEYVH